MYTHIWRTWAAASNCVFTCLCWLRDEQAVQGLWEYLGKLWRVLPAKAWLSCHLWREWIATAYSCQPTWPGWFSPLSPWTSDSQTLDHGIEILLGSGTPDLQIFLVATVAHLSLPFSACHETVIPSAKVQLPKSCWNYRKLGTLINYCYSRSLCWGWS